MYKTGFFDPHGGSVTAESADDLIEKLGGVDIKIPRRDNGRSSVDRERRCVVLYLLSLAANGRLDFPLTIGRLAEDPPDFLLTMGEKRIALEHTDAGTQDHQLARTKLSRADRGSMLLGEKTILSPDDKRPESMLAFIGSVREWAEVVGTAVRSKSKALDRYPEADAYHLLIYDLVHIDLDEDEIPEATGYLAPVLSPLDSSPRSFSVVSVLRADQLLYDIGGEAAVLDLVH